jgi:hypothetical protein
MIFEIKCAFQLFASRPVEAETQMLLTESPTFLERFRCGTLKAIFDMAVFQSDEYKRFQSLVEQAENQHFDTQAMLSQPATNGFEMVVRDTVGPVLNAITLQVNGTGIQNQQILHNQELLLNYMVGYQATNGRPGESIASLRIPQNRDRRMSNGPNIGEREVIPVQLVPNAEDDTLKGGHHCRKNKRAVSEEDRLRAEEYDGVPRPPLKGSDDHCKTLTDFWRLYKDKWEPLEKEYGCKWRTDAPVLLQNGKKKRISNGRAAWWSRRKGMYDFVLLRKQFFMAENPGLVESEAEAEALVEGEEIFNAVPASRDGHRKIEDVNHYFREALGHNNQKGRPWKFDPFSSAFGDVEINPSVMADLTTDS